MNSTFRNPTRPANSPQHLSQNALGVLASAVAPKVAPGLCASVPERREEQSGELHGGTCEIRGQGGK